jgi:HJR/Mrr/RecB family endonuclease
VGVVRELYGVKVAQGATKAIMATTTYFTKPAKTFQHQHKWELDLADFKTLQNWIAGYLRLRSP